MSGSELPLVPSIKLRTGSELIEGYAPFERFKDRFGWRPFEFRVNAHAHEFIRAWSFCVWCRTMPGIGDLLPTFSCCRLEDNPYPSVERRRPGAACSKSDLRSLEIRDG